MNANEPSELNPPRKPRPMRKNPVLALLLGATGVVISAQGFQCQPFDSTETRTLGIGPVETLGYVVPAGATAPATWDDYSD